MLTLQSIDRITLVLTIASIPLTFLSLILFTEVKQEYQKEGVVIMAIFVAIAGFFLCDIVMEILWMNLGLWGWLSFAIIVILCEACAFWKIITRVAHQKHTDK